MMAQLVRFVAVMPNWTGSDGLPLSWHHFAYGSRHLDRLDARRILDMGAAVRGGMSTKESYVRWEREIEART